VHYCHPVDSNVIRKGSNEMASLNSESIGAVRDQAAQLFQSIIEQATSKAMDEARSSREKAGRFTRNARKHSAPSVRDVALNAASGAIELWQAARDRAGETMDTVQSTVTDSASEIKHGAQGIKEEAVDRVKSVTHVVGDSAHKAADTSKSAAVNSARTGRNTLGLALWTGAAGAIIYYAFLNEERRTQARNLAMRAINEGRALLQDLQGQDGEFTS
jgi:hypothetical protein